MSQVRWIATTLAVMLLGFILVRWLDRDVLVAVATAIAIVGVGQLSGLSWAGMGLSRSTWVRGLVWALASFGAVAAVYLVLLLSPFDALLDDSRYDDGWAQAWITALVIVPLGTVLWEELAFRGVLWGQLHARWSTPVATVASSLLFGLWHALPALRFAESNESVNAVSEAAASQPDRSVVATIVTVVLTVLVTGIGGAVLCEMRRRSESLLAPIRMHWALNGIGVLAVAASSPG